MPSWSTPPTFVAANTLTAAQMNTYVSDNTTYMYDLFHNAWATYTPTVTQSGAVTKTVNRAAYMQAGKFVTVSVMMTMTGSGTGNNAVTVSLPVTASTSNQGIVVGSGAISDISANILYPVTARLVSTTTVNFIRTDAQPAGQWGVDPNIALASTDVIAFQITYEAA